MEHFQVESEVRCLLAFLDPLRELTVGSVLLRLTLAMLFGGMIGLERGRKRRPAGFRTYMFVCLGAAMTMLLSQYEATAMQGIWSGLASQIGVKSDISRFGAQVINGVGFLGAGTIIVTSGQEVKGLTTAAGLWASACMGLAVGAGFYECVFLAFAMIFLCVRFLPSMENFVIKNSHNMNIYVEFISINDIKPIINCIRAQDAQIYDVEITHVKESKLASPGAVFFIHLNHSKPHTQILSAISQVDHVRSINEI